MIKRKYWTLRTMMSREEMVFCAHLTMTCPLLCCAASMSLVMTTTVMMALDQTQMMKRQRTQLQQLAQKLVLRR